MRRNLHLSTVTSAVRARICAKCPARTAGDDSRTDLPRACELTCPHFRGLARLWGVAATLDPMVGRFGSTMARAVRAVERPRRARGGRVSRRGAQFVQTLRQLSGH